MKPKNLVSVILPNSRTLISNTRPLPCAMAKGKRIASFPSLRPSSPTCVVKSSVCAYSTRKTSRRALVKSISPTLSPKNTPMLRVSLSGNTSSQRPIAHLIRTREERCAASSLILRLGNARSSKPPKKQASRSASVVIPFVTVLRPTCFRMVTTPYRARTSGAQRRAYHQSYTHVLQRGGLAVRSPLD